MNIQDIKSKIIVGLMFIMSVLAALWGRDRSKLKTIKVISQERQKAAQRAADTARQETKRKVEDAKNNPDDLTTFNDR